MPFLKTGKTQEGVPVLEGGLPGKFLGTEKPQGGGYPFWKEFMGKNLRNGKNSGGGTLSEGGLPGNFEDWEKRRLEPIQNGKIQGGGTLLEGGLPERFGETKISYYICAKE